ncbi:hypothetical protein PYCCODRAFT_79179 [Trametes coccinea BRFM310]|uniref:Secreted protein n=1 Tax=Trametes coccinea (strain BRFM310) TaxID=1353009 RepID=A0A1Y2IW31_TRAC3|nr:hypothetical protein PYCCODRAFT_79179 [Trametes coccinea BRFM310]
MKMLVVPTVCLWPSSMGLLSTSHCAQTYITKELRTGYRLGRRKKPNTVPDVAYACTRLGQRHRQAGPPQGTVSLPGKPSASRAI